MSVTRGSYVEVFNVAIASQSSISEEMLSLNQIENGRLTYEDHSGVDWFEFALKIFDFRDIVECHLRVFFTGWKCPRHRH